MRLVAGQVNDLLNICDDELFSLISDSIIYVLGNDLNRSLSGGDRIMNLLEGALSPIPLNEIMFNRVHNLYSKYGEGISFENLCKVEFCRARQIGLLTDDKALTYIAGEEKILVVPPKYFKRELYLESIRKSNSKPKVLIKVNRKDI